MVAAELFDESRLVAHVAQHEDGVDVACLEDRAQQDRLVRTAVGVAEHDVVTMCRGRRGHGLHRAAEEGVDDVADDDPEEHRARAAQTAREWVRTVAEAARGRRGPALGSAR